MNCIFCNSDLTPDTKPEHILLSALGGRKTTRRTTCSECNGVFGSTIDKALTDQVVFVRSLLRLESGDGREPPIRKKVQAGSDVINVLGDGSLELSSPFTTTDLGNGNFAVSIRAVSQEDFAQSVRHIAAKLGTSEEQIWDQIRSKGAKQVVKRPGVIRQDLQFGGPLAGRSIVKSCLELWSTVVGNNELRSSLYDEARRFVVTGDDAFLSTRVDLDSRFLPMVDDLKEKFGDFFNLIYVASDANGRVVGHFTLYNLTGWQAVLAERNAPPNVKVGLISNPQSPGSWSDTIAEGITLGFDWLNTPDYYSDDLARMRARLGAMMEHHQKLSGSQNTRGIIEDAVDKYGLTDQRADPASEVQRRMIDEISRRVATSAMNLPYEEELSAAELERLLARNRKK